MLHIEGMIIVYSLQYTPMAVDWESNSSLWFRNVYNITLLGCRSIPVPIYIQQNIMSSLYMDINQPFPVWGMVEQFRITPPL